MACCLTTTVLLSFERWSILITESTAALSRWSRGNVGCIQWDSKRWLIRQHESVWLNNMELSFLSCVTEFLFLKLSSRIKGNWNTLLSNYEVLDILQNTKSYKKQKTNQLATITYQTIKYLEDTPCKKQSKEKITEFLKAMESKKLTKAEKLTLLNLCPTTPLEIQLVIFLCTALLIF